LCDQGKGQAEVDHLLRILLNIILLFLIVETVRSLARGGGGLFRRLFGKRKRSKAADNPRTPEPESYSKITPYDIEDAEFEEIRDETHVR